VRTPLTVGVVGLGPHGLELARVFEELPDAELRWTCDASREALRNASGRHPSAFASRALAVSGAVADGLLALAQQRHRRLMVSNPLLFQPAMRKLKELIDLGRLGDVYYIAATAQTSPAAGEDSILWSVGVGMVHALLHLVEDEPVASVVRADAYARPGTLEVASCWFRFATGITATAQLSWLDARETIRLSVVGSRRTAVLDARALDRRLTVFERHGPIICPRLPAADPLRIECESFVSRIRAAGELPAPHGAAAAVAIVEELEHEATADDAPAAHLPPRPRLELVRP
jgi:predicted dehydrogenase